MNVQYRSAVQTSGLTRRQLSRVLNFGCEATKFGNEMLVKGSIVYMTIEYETLIKQLKGYISDKYIIKVE